MFIGGPVIQVDALNNYNIASTLNPAEWIMEIINAQKQL
jgi:hypothetical protein